MNQTISALAQAFAPPVLWNSFQRRRGRAGNFPWREFGCAATCANASELLAGKFADLYERYHRLDPHVPRDVDRYRIYNVCWFANLCCDLPGDFACAGVSYGVAPRIVYDFVDFGLRGETLHLIDPFEGIVSNGAVAPQFNREPDYVLRQYPPGAPIALHRRRIPIKLPGPLAFVFTNTGNPAADAEALPIFYEALVRGGVFITNQYANNIQHYRPVLRRLDITPLWLPSGQGVFFKR